MELAQCKAKLAQLSIRDMGKLLVQCKTSVNKNDVLQLNELIERYDFDEEKERDNVKQKLRLLKAEVNRLMKELKQYSNSQEYLNRIENISNNIIQASNQMKSEMALRFEELLTTEEQLTEDLQNFNSRMDNFEKLEKVQIQKKVVIQQNDDQSELGQLKSKIDHLENKIANLKMLDSEDQAQFLRVRTKHKGKMGEQFIYDCLKAIPYITQDQLMQQIDNYNKYLKWEEEKKEILVDYKRKKEEQRLKQLEDQQIQQQAVKVVQQQKIVPQEDRDKLKEEIKQWRMKRSTQKVVEEINIEQKKEVDLEKLERLKREKELKKLQVQQFKEQKLLEQQREQELKQVETMSRRFVSQEAKERIKLKENTMLQKKLSILEMKEQKQFVDQMKQQNRIEDKYVKFSHVESKLTEPTKAMEMQKRQKFDPSLDKGKYADTFGGNLLGNGRRGMPQWRQNL